uniref:Zn(2)-C6 fungal-type domain-containing protein n=1 Tax=Mycena chlorophos TaxID=658473 RepID=A0ABQ0LTJ1_MYCCL|nr:predicted protein [Mycena chlorophos]
MHAGPRVGASSVPHDSEHAYPNLRSSALGKCADGVQYAQQTSANQHHHEQPRRALWAASHNPVPGSLRSVADTGTYGESFTGGFLAKKTCSPQISASSILVSTPTDTASGVRTTCATTDDCFRKVSRYRRKGHRMFYRGLHLAPCISCREAKIKCTPNDESDRPQSPCRRCIRKGLDCIYPDSEISNIGTPSGSSSTRRSASSSSSSPSRPPSTTLQVPTPPLPYTGPPPPNSHPRYPIGTYPALAISPHFAHLSDASAQPRTQSRRHGDAPPPTGYDAYIHAYHNVPDERELPPRLRAVLEGRVAPGMPLPMPMSMSMPSRGQRPQPPYALYHNHNHSSENENGGGGDTVTDSRRPFEGE